VLETVVRAIPVVDESSAAVTPGRSRTIAMNAPGQSGRLGDPHHTDLFAPWAAGESFPLRYSRAAVDAAAEHVIALEP
jgi:acyl-homoserine lactone acylase PvdQ